jgi:hypothetical protein
MSKIAPRNAFDCDLSQDAATLVPGQETVPPRADAVIQPQDKFALQKTAREHSQQVHNAQLHKASFTYTREGSARPK